MILKIIALPDNSNVDRNERKYGIFIHGFPEILQNGRDYYAENKKGCLKVDSNHIA